MVTYRSDEPGQQRLGPYLAELDRGGRAERLELARLDRAETAAQLTGILGAAPAVDLVDGVFVRSEGNPFFTEELVESTRAGLTALPTTLRDLLRGRIEALPESAQQVLTGGGGCWPADSASAAGRSRRPGRRGAGQCVAGGGGPPAAGDS